MTTASIPRAPARDLLRVGGTAVPTGPTAGCGGPYVWTGPEGWPRPPDPTDRRPTVGRPSAADRGVAPDLSFLPDPARPKVPAEGCRCLPHAAVAQHGSGRDDGSGRGPLASGEAPRCIPADRSPTRTRRMAARPRGRPSAGLPSR